MHELRVISLPFHNGLREFGMGRGAARLASDAALRRALERPGWSVPDVVEIEAVDESRPEIARTIELIRRLAGPTVTVLGPRPFADLRHHYARCQALIFPGEEDFGIVPVEAMASGRPVIAYGSGGATETVLPRMTGLLFNEQSPEALIDAVEQYRVIDFDPQKIAAHARQFSRERFIVQMTAQFDHLLARRQDRKPAHRDDTPWIAQSK